jgi:hypothetical protein
VRMSSTTTQPTARWPARVCSRCSSESIRTRTTVLDTDTAQPKTTAAGQSWPASRATVAPNPTATAAAPRAPGTATRRTSNSSRTWKWRPTPKSRRITPTSASWPAIARSAAKPGVKGPTATPARM